jgi:DNA repair protein RecO (recombination protein O)
MHIQAPAIICGVRHHGEHGAIVRVLSPDDGLVAGYVQGGRATAMRPVLQPANLVTIDCRARTEAQLPSMKVELQHSRGPLFAEPLAAAGLEWLTALTARTLPEQQAFPPLYQALEAALAAIEAAPTARGWVVALVRYELLLLCELGFGLDLDHCAVTGEAMDLAYVSPRTGRAVSRPAGEGYRDRLLPFPAFLQGEEHPGLPALLDGLTLTGHFIERDLLHGPAAVVLAARERLIDRLNKMVA